jgi:hypothetical protein
MLIAEGFFDSLLWALAYSSKKLFSDQLSVASFQAPATGKLIADR